MEEQIKSLKRVLVNQHPILFTGAGFSKGAKNQKGKDMPDGNYLKSEILIKLLSLEKNSDDYKELINNTLSEVCEYTATLIPSTRLEDFLVEMYSNCNPAPYHNVYNLYKWKKIYTTNIDDIIEHIFDPNSILVQNLNRPKSTSGANKIEYIKLHGCVRNPSGGFVFTSRDYIDSMLKSKDYRFNQFGLDIQYQDFIFIGFDYNETNLNYYLMLYEENGGSSKGQLFFINPKPSKIFEGKVKKLGGTIIKWTTEEFANFLEKEIIETKSNEDNICKDIDGFYNLSKNISNLKSYKSYRSNLYLGYDPKWYDILNDWDFSSKLLLENFETYTSYITIKNIKHSIYTIIGKTMSGKSVFLKRLGLELHNEGYQVYEFNGRKFDYYSFIKNAKELPTDKFCLIIDNASYYYGALRTLLKIFPNHKELIILSSSRPFFHNRKRYNLVTEDFFEYNIEYGISKDYAIEIENKLSNKGFLGELKKMSEIDRINFIIKSNDVSHTLFSITYGKGFYKRFQSNLQNQFHHFTEESKDLLATLSIFEKLDLAYFPLEIMTLIYHRYSKNILNEVQDFIRFNENNGIELRNNFLMNEILDKIPFNKILEIIKEILVNISPQISNGIHSFWNEIQSSLMKEKLLRKKLGIKTSAIKNMLFDIQNYYNENYNYWIQVGISEQMEFEYEKALNHFRQAEALSPNSYMVRNAIARNFLKQANFYDDYESAKPYFDEGEQLMLALISDREEYQVKAFSTHCYLYEKINFLNKFNIKTTDQELKQMFSLLKAILDKDEKDGMAKHISNRFFEYLKMHNKTNIIDINFYDLSHLKLMFEKYDIDIESLFEDFEIDE